MPDPMISGTWAEGQLPSALANTFVHTTQLYMAILDLLTPQPLRPFTNCRELMESILPTPPTDTSFIYWLSLKLFMLQFHGCAEHKHLKREKRQGEGQRDSIA